MVVTNCYTVDGEIAGESTGLSVINYATDALGSVIGTLVGGQLQSTDAYKPFGALIAQATAPDSNGSVCAAIRSTGRVVSEGYVRARHCGTGPGRWTSLDPQWPGEPKYIYVADLPTQNADYWGLASCADCCCCPTSITFDETKYDKIVGNKRDVLGNRRWGHHFELKYTLEGKVSNGMTGDCTTQWCECSNADLPRPNSRTEPPLGAFTWWDLASFGKPLVPPFSGHVDCGSTVTRSLADEPTVTERRPKELGRGNERRYLWIVVHIIPPAGCGSDAQTFKATQILGVKSMSPFQSDMKLWPHDADANVAPTKCKPLSGPGCGNGNAGGPKIL